MSAGTGGAGAMMPGMTTPPSTDTCPDAARRRTRQSSASLDAAQRDAPAVGSGCMNLVMELATSAQSHCDYRRDERRQRELHRGRAHRDQRLPRLHRHGRAIARDRRRLSADARVHRSRDHLRQQPARGVAELDRHRLSPHPAARSVDHGHGLRRRRRLRRDRHRARHEHGASKTWSSPIPTTARPTCRRHGTVEGPAPPAPSRRLAELVCDQHLRARHQASPSTC